LTARLTASERIETLASIFGPIPIRHSPISHSPGAGGGGGERSLSGGREIRIMTPSRARVLPESHASPTQPVQWHSNHYERDLGGSFTVGGRIAERGGVGEGGERGESLLGTVVRDNGRTPDGGNGDETQRESAQMLELQRERDQTTHTHRGASSLLPYSLSPPFLPSDNQPWALDVITEGPYTGKETF